MIIVVLVVTGWSYGARQLRAQALSLRNRDFLESARVRGERRSYIIVCRGAADDDVADRRQLPRRRALRGAHRGRPAVPRPRRPQLAELGHDAATGRRTTRPCRAASRCGSSRRGCASPSSAPRSRCSTTPSTRSATPHCGRSGGPVASALVPDATRAGGAGPHRRVRHGRRSGPRGRRVRPRRPRRASSSAWSASRAAASRRCCSRIAQLLSPPAAHQRRQRELPRPGPGHHDRRRSWRRLRWRDCSVVMQSAMNALNPVTSIGAQFEDAMRAHGERSARGDRSSGRSRCCSWSASTRCT